MWRVLWRINVGPVVLAFGAPKMALRAARERQIAAAAALALVALAGRS